METDSVVDILVLGATGYTGRLISKYLAAHPQRSDFTFALCARSKLKLDALAHVLRLESSVPHIVVDVSADFARLEQAVRRAKVIINTIGPYWKYGTPVVRACVRHKRHYVDLSGETPWIHQIIREFDYTATKAGSFIVPSCGLDSLPSDYAVHLAHKALDGAPLGLSTSAFKIRGGLSGGSLATILLYAEAVEISKELIAVAREDFSLSPVRGVRQPRPRFLYRLPHLHPAVYGSFFIMSLSNRAIVQRTWGLRAQSSDLARGDDNSHDGSGVYGPAFEYDEFLQMPSILSALRLTLALFFGAIGIAFFPLFRWAVRKWGPQPGEGPDDSTLEQGSLTLTNVTSTADAQRVVKTIIRGHGDPGYFLTSAMISECALALVLDGVTHAPGGTRGGVLTPVCAFGDSLVRRLERTGLFEFDSVDIVNGLEARSK